MPNYDIIFAPIITEKSASMEIDGKYVFKNPISEENIKAMRDNMSAEDIKAFDDFLDMAWR